ncbi:MAG: hypothetical protein A2785_01715 [Candidatus Chisholmbacteria bacterium RIFCSPHIGHO2_01_FULL_49_18]|uniref:Uncharacterized protein n=2 Tax=Candidatus Chisholmiibacteriota TaxID=1817900 RepID=A0A1G1VLJ7_9BACT|nr:MAG: hypothetical protein A2785_01715 [Candidatus Chisholmbacteria bacterium RIFCSPHIGHO2_01_FULL_49_18]OGY21737.1 MAG: hypothetical protein A3A65_02100 [Candidatus Chisholmbacteria bacterium RIFCSPLOWO2_01_FULL_49_14]
MPDGFENTKLLREMVEGETCYFRASGFSFKGSRVQPELWVETDYRVWIKDDSPHNNIPITKRGDQIWIPDQYRPKIEREISLGGGSRFDVDGPAKALPVVFV